MPAIRNAETSGQDKVYQWDRKDMTNFDFDEIEEDLDLVVPEIYRLFVEAVDANNIDLAKWNIYDNTQTLLKGNWYMRVHCGDGDPQWKNQYLDFGVGDGCGNHFFLVATDAEDDIVQLWSHDPPGIEDVASGTEFFHTLLRALRTDFAGDVKYYFAGTAFDWPE